MNSIEITLPFQRISTMEGGRVRRNIEDHPVSLRVFTVPELGRAAKVVGGHPILEVDGFGMAYIGKSRESASLKRLTETLERRAQRTGQAHHLSGARTSPPTKGVAEDGSAAIRAAVSAVEARYVVVDGCVAELSAPPEIVLSILHEGGRTGGTDAVGVPFLDFPWLRFAMIRREEADATAEALTLHLEGALPGTVVGFTSPDYDILDEAAAGRMAERLEAGREAEWTRALLKLVTFHVGLLGEYAARPYFALRAAYEGEAKPEALVSGMRDLAAALSDVARPEHLGESTWLSLKVAGLSLTARLDAEPDTSPSPRR